jgi:hypothetical protein
MVFDVEPKRLEVGARTETGVAEFTKLTFWDPSGSLVLFGANDDGVLPKKYVTSPANTAVLHSAAIRYASPLLR